MRQVLSVCLLPVLLAGCATSVPRVVLPVGPGGPLPDYASRFEAAVAACSDIRTYEALVRLGGRGGGADIGGRVRAGLAAPGSLRLELVAAFGAPRFYFVARPGEAALWLTREAQLLSGAPPAEIFASLTGIRLDPDDLRAVLTGCLVTDAMPLGGRDYGDTVAVDLEGGAVAYLRDVDGASRLVAGTRDRLTLEFSDFRRGMPRHVRVVSDDVMADNRPMTDVSATLSQVNIDLPMPDSAFRLDGLRLPDDLTLITLDELRGVAPLEPPPPTQDR